MKISDKTIKALIIVRGEPQIYPSRFAKQMWLNSPAWRRIYNVGNGATTGVGIIKCAGSYLAKLKYAGLIRVERGSVNRYTITEAGIKILEERKSL